MVLEEESQIVNARSAVAILSTLVISVAAATGAARPIDPPRGSFRTNPTNIPDAALLELFARAEAGDVDHLASARAKVTGQAVRAIIDAKLAAAQLNLPAVRAAVARAERRHPALVWHALALAIRAEAAFGVGAYAAAERDCSAWLALPQGTDPIHSRAGMTQMSAIAEQLAHLPGQTVSRRELGSSRTWRDKAALVRTVVTLNGRRQEVVLDTGANLSVVTASTAKTLGLQPAGASDVQSSSRAAVPVRLTVAKRLEIAGTSLGNVAFLVMSDADLRLPLPGGYEIPAILGFPVLRALGRFSLTDRSLRAPGMKRQHAQAAKLIASGSDLFVRAHVERAVVPLRLDSGASNTALGSRFAADHPELVAGLPNQPTRSAGAGGSVEGTARVLKDVRVEIGGMTKNVPAVDVVTSDAAGTGNFGTLGQDVLRSFGGYSIDFRRMTLTLIPVGAPGARRR